MSIIIKTQLEYAVMDIQRYEFQCSGCFMVKTISDHAIGTVCKGCV